jgi:hypothetical protein
MGIGLGDVLRLPERHPAALTNFAKIQKRSGERMSTYYHFSMARLGAGSVIERPQRCGSCDVSIDIYLTGRTQ